MAKDLIVTKHGELNIDIYKFESDGEMIIELSNPNNEEASVVLRGKCAEELVSHINGFLGILKIKGVR